MSGCLRTFASGGTLLLALLTFTLLSTAQTPVTLYTFTGAADGSGPNAVAIGAGGVLYGTTGGAGTEGNGTAFSLTPPVSSGGAWTGSFYSFPGGRAGTPASGPLAVANGGSVLFGAGAYIDSANEGTVYELMPPTSPDGTWAERTLYEFTGAAGDGHNPNSVIVAGGPGGGPVLYGTTLLGGSGPEAGFGTVFSLTPPLIPGGHWTETVLYSFQGAPNDGEKPTANVLVGSGGALYGTTGYGGTNNSGTVFSLTPPSSPGDAWTETVLYNFPSAFYGCAPGQMVQLGARGTLYGVASTCGHGRNNHGMVFSLSPPVAPGGEWTPQVLHTFTGGPSDGENPNSLAAYNGLLYGTTAVPGPGNVATSEGTIFSLTPPASEGDPWIETVLYFFTGGSDGAVPTGIVTGPDGVLYGATNKGGGTSNSGTVFSFTP
ncbi:MAG: choice-of-anchor tandem repeat GloVer-containing protein [Bryobacteraceae bacterium]